MRNIFFSLLKYTALAVFAIVLSGSPGAAAQAPASDDNRANLTAESMHYDPETGDIRARGNVHLSRADGELFGDRGIGSTNGMNFEMQGNVRGSFKRENLDIVCEAISLQTDRNPTRRKIVANGNVVLTQNKDKISSQTLVWEMDRVSYKATGAVIGTFAQYFIDADEIGRNEGKFWAARVRKYHDRSRNLTLSAAKANGVIRNDEVVELLVEGNVVMDSPDDKGKMSRITGDKGLFSVERGTIVISGNAAVLQEGRKLHATNIVYDLETGRVDAIGSSSLTIDIDKQE